MSDAPGCQQPAAAGDPAWPPVIDDVESPMLSRADLDLMRARWETEVPADLRRRLLDDGDRWKRLYVQGWCPGRVETDRGVPGEVHYHQCSELEGHDGPCQPDRGRRHDCTRNACPHVGDRRMT